MKRDRSKIVGLILAAGYSSRMGEFKPLLSIGKSTAIERCVGSLRDAGIEDVRVVVGWRAEELIPLLGRLKAGTVLNRHFADGMYSSVMAGVASLGPETQGFVLLPVDSPMVKPRTISELVQRFLESEATVVYPRFLGRRGHPPVVSTSCLSGAPASEPPDGLRSVLSRYEDSALVVDVVDQGTVMDMDTPADYEALRRYCSREGVPTEAECEAVLAVRQVPARVIQHSRTVAKVALRLASLLQQQGLMLDLDLVLAAALLHDVARDLPNHAAEGARIVSEMGYPRVAVCILRHMDLEPDQVHRLAEHQLVYLADKLVKEDRVVSLQERLALTAARHAGQPEALGRAAARLRDAEIILEQVARALGVSADRVMADLRTAE